MVVGMAPHVQTQLTELLNGASAMVTSHDRQATALQVKLSS